MNATAKMRDLILATAKKIWEAYRPEKIVLFGSYAYGKPDADSDVDLLIIKATDSRALGRWREVREIVYERGRGVSIQPIVMTPDEIADRLKIGDQFVEEILVRGEVLYDRE